MKIPFSGRKNGNLPGRAVLFLNANYAPMMICTAKRAICMDYLDKVDILVSYNDKVRSPSTIFDLPSVIKIKDYVRHDNLSVDLNRKNIIARDEYTCQYCGVSKTPLTIDHITPKGKGGGDSWENLVAACKPCNQKKGNRTPEQAGMKLLKEPKPLTGPGMLKRRSDNLQEDWKNYLDIYSPIH